jgi:hypothetical protein
MGQAKTFGLLFLATETELYEEGNAVATCSDEPRSCAWSDAGVFALVIPDET